MNLRADRYGLRTVIAVDDVPIKLEVVFEARIELEQPGLDDVVCGVPALTPLDMVATKLLANSDRWADDASFSRDLVDLAMMKPEGELIERAVEKATTAYGESIESDMSKAIEHALAQRGRLDRAILAMRISAPKALLVRLPQLTTAAPPDRASAE